MILSAYAPAKINLGLEIISKRADGYHELDMIMQSINLFDKITIEATHDKKISVFHNKNIDCPEQEDITYKSANAFFKSLNKECKGIKITIDKKIPLSAGLAGGSTDGAGVLVLLNNMYGKPFSQSELMKIGGVIGSDIPFCILGGTSRATGTGTTLKAIKYFGDYSIILINPNISISTKEAYKLSDTFVKKEIKNFDLLEKYIINQDFTGISKNLYNRFEDLISKEIVQNIKQDLLLLGADVALMSGSGPTVYGIFKDEILAQKCYSKLKSTYRNIFLCKPISHGVKTLDFSQN